MTCATGDRRSLEGTVVHVTGARPNFPKAAPVIRGLAMLGVPQGLVHTGQHYDVNMSDVFFQELGLPEPDLNLGIGGGSHAEQTAAIMIALEQLLSSEPAAMLVVYGDVNSTVAAALVAAKLGVPIAHVEAGLRSFDMTMPEEINRIVTDRLADILLATSPDALVNLGNEGVAPGRAFLVGNPMIDSLLAVLDRIDTDGIRDELGLHERYAVATLHRPGNVDDDDAVRRAVRAIHTVADQVGVVLPLHPRGRDRLQAAGLFDHPALTVIEPRGYLDFVGLMRGAAAVVTDSGGVQEETTVLGVPCLTLRPNTERPITITDGTNRLVTADELQEVVADVLAAGRPQTWPIPPLWDGRAGERIARVIAKQLK